jgi:outer membrane lipoprotein-sorting protein
MRGVLAGFLCLALALVARAADPFAHPASGARLLETTLSRPAARLAQARTLAGGFRQSRYLRELPKPLIASGEFVFARDLGVYWHTAVPFDSVIVLNDAGMTQIDEGAPALRMSADEQPAVRLVGNLFAALFTLDVTRLNQDFELYDATEGKRWTLGLKPRAPALASVIRQVVVAGSDDVETVELTDAQGDRTLIELSAIRYSRDGPPADVRALLAPAHP